MAKSITAITSTAGFFTEDNSVEAVNARMGEDISPRLKEVMSCLVKHLHSFAREIELRKRNGSSGSIS